MAGGSSSSGGDLSRVSCDYTTFRVDLILLNQIRPFRVSDLTEFLVLTDEVGLRSLVKFSRLRFYNLYVKPYPECEKIYGRFVDVKVGHRHPEGLWKLFKPPKYSDSKEYLKNIRFFMEQLR
ncbi:hypothetical protein L1987_18327 [Smallanthus sonchifolius]|uniref:Uncharacterized protein n=1 Tax=Smallanthus sonchifolius TaxID=185202 RepID=A0ACB9IZY2_9ASTR|nr:hypothetical protein L1987_18327 [Smallanthus sonchifolius]